MQCIWIGVISPYCGTDGRWTRTFRSLRMVVQDAVEFRVAGLPQVGAIWNSLADGKRKESKQTKNASTG